MANPEEEYRFRINWHQRIRYRNVIVFVFIVLGVYILFLQPSSTNNFIGIAGQDNFLTGRFIDTGISDVFLTLGDKFILKINFTNTYNDTSNITLKLDPQGSNYIARFLDHPLANVFNNRRDVNTSLYPLSPLEERTFEIEITAVDFEGIDGNLIINGTIKSCLTCNESIVVSVTAQEPVNFPGLEMPAIILLITLAGVIYWRKVDSGSYPEV